MMQCSFWSEFFSELLFRFQYLQCQIDNILRIFALDEQPDFAIDIRQNVFGIKGVKRQRNVAAFAMAGSNPIRRYDCRIA